MGLRIQLWLKSSAARAGHVLNDLRSFELGPSLSYNKVVGRTLIILGLVLVAVGVLIAFGERLPIKLGRLPGDIVIRGKYSVFYFPIVTSLLLSVILTLAMWLFHRR